MSGDRALLERLVDNLLDNAVAHNVDGGWVRVATSSAEGSAVLVVANGGARLDPTEAQLLFDRFRRLNRARSRSHGFGLGLSVVRAVAQAHGGHARLLALESGGLCAEVRIPLGDPTDVVATAATAAPRPARATEPLPDPPLPGQPLGHPA